MNPYEGSARPNSPSLRGTCIARTFELANPPLIDTWKWNFEEISDRLYAISVIGPTVLRNVYPNASREEIKDLIERQSHKIEQMIKWADAQLLEENLQIGQPGRLELLNAAIRTPLANAYIDLLIHVDYALRLLDSLWLQGALTDAGHTERVSAMRRIPRRILGEIRKAHAHYRRDMRAQYARQASSTARSTLTQTAVDG
ncbi:MAG: DUF1845 family protein [Proteobacteria bacterium]|uniref:AcaB family transcriptional regulator n=1 Tax=Zoogloea sp. LCSB751 TaxID=1965277 RepID=UPI0011172CBE|nr:AcaB family transcriptional regulator [Zoogloea sp. LCSB751]MBS0353924.1 DUF1845 family protein [Pseudomonadota bacterium]